MRWLRYGGVGLALAAVGCSSGDDGIPDNQPVQTQARLQSFDRCEDLEAYIEDTAVLDMRAQIKWQKESIGRWGRGGPIMVDDGGLPPASPSPEAGGDSAGGPGTGNSAPDDYTGTNNQVEGVDEADFVKNDGTRIFVISGNKLYAHRSWPAASLSAVGSLTLEGWPREMFLQDNRVVVFSQVSLQEMGNGGKSDLPCDFGYCGYYGLSATKVTVVDVTDLASPQVQDELYLPGYYSSARRTDSAVRLLLNDSFRWPDGVKWWPDYSEDLWANESRVKKELDALMVQNEKLIRARTLKQWLPSGIRKRPDGSKVEVGYDCRDFYRSNTPAKLGFVTVASLNLDASAGESTVRRTSLVTDPGEVYASTDSLYLASRHWWWWPEDGQKDYTYLHKFDISDPGAARYVGSGVMEGHPLNQFSLDEHQGVLRVASTIATHKESDGNPWGRQELTNRVFTFREEGGHLVKVGQSEELAKGESIYSARFLGNKGYVVTFRQVDPLFTFDLSDPAHPRKVGELKVPGYSSYIHPLDENHLLTVGVHIPENSNDWRLRAVKLSLFDVTDPAHPQEAFTQLVGTSYGWSEALWEHKAFNFFPSKGLLALPFSDYDPNQYDYWSGFRSELRVFHVDATTGFTNVGSLSMSDLYQAQHYQNWTWYWTPSVRRSVMADDYVYAITDAGVRVAHVSNLQAPLATANFSPDFTLSPYYP
ncbi:beta-propeller domain-containing protein [Hyalangium versicolor]|uniref:beta-propeller domain-containing protein n=1 Tax=Hyalangium versicolor TaxID=2861190 RepID=UPI001CC98431|nr:beta-propeller domain-containing protein [Hyalangium versicolor]